MENDEELEEDELGFKVGDTHPNSYHTFGQMNAPSKYKDIGEYMLLYNSAILDLSEILLKYFVFEIHGGEHGIELVK